MVNKTAVAMSRALFPSLENIFELSSVKFQGRGPNLLPTYNVCMSRRIQSFFIYCSILIRLYFFNAESKRSVHESGPDLRWRDFHSGHQHGGR